MYYFRDILPKCPICKDMMLSHVYPSKSGHKMVDSTCNKRLSPIYDIDDHSLLVRKDLSNNILLQESLQLPGRDLSISVHHDIPRTVIIVSLKHYPWSEIFVLPQNFDINYENINKLMDRIKLYVTFS